MADKDTPRASDDLDTAERKSLSVDERVPDRQGPDGVPTVELPGAVAANVPQSGLGATGPLDGGALGPGETALQRERKAQQTRTQRG